MNVATQILIMDQMLLVCFLQIYGGATMCKSMLRTGWREQGENNADEYLSFSMKDDYNT